MEIRKGNLLKHTVVGFQNVDGGFDYMHDENPLLELHYMGTTRHDVDSLTK